MNAENRKQLAARLRAGSWPQCKVCDVIIPLGRLESLPDTETCIKHSTEQAYIGVPSYAHKTAAEVAKVKPDPEAPDGLGESVRQLLRGYHRGR